MYRITLFNEVPGTLGGLITCVKETPELCFLEYYKMLRSEHWVQPKFNCGPLQTAPEGLYQLFHDAPGTKDGFFMCDLVISKRLWLLGETVIQRSGKTAAGLSLESHVLRSFQALLAQSEKELHVYQRGNNPADRRYLMEWPDETPANEPGDDGTDDSYYPGMPDYKYIGKANLDNGAIG